MWSVFRRFNVCSFIGNVRLCVGIVFFLLLGGGAICERKCYLQYIYIGIMVRIAIFKFSIYTQYTRCTHSYLKAFGNERTESGGQNGHRAEQPHERAENVNWYKSNLKRCENVKGMLYVLAHKYRADSFDSRGISRRKIILLLLTFLKGKKRSQRLCTNYIR